MKGQTTMAAIAMAIVILMFMFMFLLTSSLRPSQAMQNIKAEYNDLYATNLLLSVLNTDMGCGTIADLLKDEYFTVTDCSGVSLEEKLDYYIDTTLFATGQTNYEWLLETEPKNFGSPKKRWGNEQVTAAPGYWDSRTFISWTGKQIEVKLYIRTK